MTLLFTLDRIERFLGLVEDESAQRFSFLKFKLQSIRINNRTSRSIDWIIYNVTIVLGNDCKYCIESFTHKNGRPVSNLKPIAWNIGEKDKDIAMAYISSNPVNYAFNVRQNWEHHDMDIKGRLPAALFKPRTVKGTASQATPPGRCLAFTRR